MTDWGETTGEWETTPSGGDWNATPNTDWNATPNTDWNAGETAGTTNTDWDAGEDTKADISWADDAPAEDSHNFTEEHYHEVVEAPAEPAIDENGRSTGTVKTWRAEKAFGFIGRNDGGPDVFVHLKSLTNTRLLNVGDVVSYRFETGAKGASAKEVAVESAAPEADPSSNVRETGTVKGWREEKGFGFIGRDDGGDDVFCHSKEIQGASSLIVGSRVSFLFATTAKGGSAKEVRVEESAPAVEGGPREFGTVKSWNAEKGFGFIGWSGEKDAFAHKRDVVNGDDLIVGQGVSFVLEEGEKGASAKKIQEEEGVAPMVEEEEEGERMFGKVKRYDEEKGFCFIGRCDGQGDVFGHKRNFPADVEPVKGMGVSFVLESGDKGESATKIREEEEIPEMVLSDEGREFGTITKWIDDKGFGYVTRKNGGEEAHFQGRACEDFEPKKGMCVSFVYEENDKGPTAKDLRVEDPDRVARVTAVRRYGIVDFYADPASEDLTNGYGFIVPVGRQAYGAPRKYYFHMDSITTPDEYGGLWPQDYVSFIVMPARKGVQALEVTLIEKSDIPTDPTEDKGEAAMEKMHITDVSDENGAADDWGLEEAAAPSGKENEAPSAETETDEWDFSAWK